MPVAPAAVVQLAPVCRVAQVIKGAASAAGAREMDTKKSVAMRRVRILLLEEST